MAHLLMIESWMLSSGILLPQILRNMGHSYTLISRAPSRYGSFLGGEPHPVVKLARQVITADTNDLDLLLHVAAAEHHKIPFDGVITSCDYYLTAAAEVATKLGLPSASPASVKIANNKAMMRQAMMRAGLVGPKYHCVADLQESLKAAEDIGYPLVIKPTDLCGSILVQRVANTDELRQAFSAIQECQHNAREQNRENTVQMEEFLDGEEFSVESFCERGKIDFFGITDKSLLGNGFFVESGHMFPAVLTADQQDALLNCVRDALIAVGYDHGLAHTEVKLTSRGPRIIEINTRAGGNWISELIRHVRGVNPLEFAVRLAIGQPVPALSNIHGTAQSAAIQFVLPPRAGKLKALHGWDKVRQSQYVVDQLLHPHLFNKTVQIAQDNDAYLGFVMCVDQNGTRARNIAEGLIDQLVLEYYEDHSAMTENA